ncbi:ankyrin repeat domain-containing protein [Wolbachia endosymbiont of Laodelphax striatellus]|uniref:ankyrin repeat domain-containing protein n=1 Tax=Wolbachia endosymbiont of Laodelphax striatellus TaxID=368602 RepID=UPI001F4F28A4|nr:ankyrin repeat domain-containing protein [Wolbachia endosymbiont of Laodelphax striatellus]
MSYEQWEIILGIVDQKADLSKDNVIEKIKELLNKARILERKEVLRMLEGVSHKLEISNEIPIVQETPEPLKKRLKVQNIPQTLEKSEKILKEQGVSDAQKILKRVLKKLGVQETSEKSKAVTTEDVLNVRKTSEKMPVMLDTQKILEAIEKLKKASKDVYHEWKKARFNVNYWFTLNYDIHSGYDQYALLCLAMDFNLINVFNALCKAKEINIHSKGPFSQWSVLHWATENSNAKMVSELIKNGANVNSMDSSQRTTLYQPAVNGDIEIIKILIMNKVNPNVEDLMNLTALYEAARNGHKEVVRFLMNNGADIRKNGALKLTPLHIAVANVDRAMVNCIIKNDKNINKNIEIVDVLGWTPLYWAAASNNISILEVLLQTILRCRASVDIEDKLIGRSPLHIAATNGNVEAVELLINYGAEVNYKDAWGWTPFNCAAEKDNIEVMNCLIAHGANIETNDPQKILLSIHPYNYLEAVNTIIKLEIWKDVMKLIEIDNLLYAARFGNIQMLYNLLALGVNVNAHNSLRSTALIEAAKYNHSEVVEILISRGADVNAQDDLGASPLSYAVARRHWIVVMILLCYGANLSLPDNCHETVRNLAERQGISNLLMEAEERASAILTQLTAESRMMQHTAPHMLRRIESPLLPINFKFMIRGQANQIEQLQYNAKLNEKRVAFITDQIKCMQLGTNTKACPAEIDEVKEQILHSPCRWSYPTKNVNVRRVTPLANGIARMQLEPSTKLDMVEDGQASLSSIIAMKNMCTRMEDTIISRFLTHNAGRQM